MTEVSEQEVVRCVYGDGRRATHTLRVESQGVLVVCTPCKKLLDNKDKRVRCQYCGVPIIKNWRKTPIEGFAHVPNCPRSDEELIEIG